MSLKQSIVIVNEYTTKTKNGGTRGGSPGKYTLRYMARDQATETMTPVRFDDADTYITRYMARKEATESLNSVGAIKSDMRRTQGMGGLAFGYGDVSLSHQKLRYASRDIQRQFDAGKTVMKTVLSFDEAYLRENGLVSDDFQFNKRGDYRGHIDQMKLRMAIMNGVERLSRDYDDLQYVGVIQVDTAHVHCHLAMVDRGKGNIMPDGNQKGKISEAGKKAIRRGIDMYLDENQQVAMMSSSITHDRRNALCFIKKYTHKTMDEHGMPQFLLACLPEDKRLWRASTHDKSMQKPNAIVREYVKQLLRQPDSGYKDALRRIDNYAAHRQQSEDLTGQEYRRLIKNGKERLVEDCMNGVYSVLKQIPDSERRVWTPMMSAMSMSYEDMAGEQDTDPMIEFGFRLRSYSSRLNHHKKEMNKYHEAVKTYEQTTNASDDSRPLLDFFREEEEYNAKLMCKYQHFLSFLPPSEEYESEFRSLMHYKGRIASMERMRDDPSLKRMTSDRAEDYGQRVYGQHGGRYVVTAPNVLDIRIDAMKDRYQMMEDDFRVKLSGMGLSMDERGVSTKKPYEFDDVKALDIHHLGYDWVYDIEVSRPNVEAFIDAAYKRWNAFQGAKYYLEASGQADALDSLPVTDIRVMKEVADKMNIDGMLQTAATGGGKRQRRPTISLDVDYTKNIKMAVESTVESTMLFSE